MGVPSVTIQKQDFQTGSVAQSPIGVLAIIAPANSGPVNQPSSYARDDQPLQDFGPSELVEDASYTLNTAGNPIIAIRPTTAQPATYGTVDVTGMTGSSVPSAGATAPGDNYDVLVTFINGGTIGGAGIQYTFSLDGGNVTSAPQALPTGSAPVTLTIPNFSRGGSPGVSFSLAAGTVNPGDFFRCLCSHAKMNDGDLPASLEALRTSTLPWEAMLIDEEVGTGTVALVDTWLAGLEKVGKFKMAFLNTRLKGQLHVGSGIAEGETAFATSMTTLVQGSAPSIRCSLGTDGGKLTSTLTGLTLPRKTALFEAARAMLIPLGEEPAFVGRGALPGVSITTQGGNPAFHNEELYPNLDQLLLTTLRSLNGQAGVYITNGRIFSTVGSDYVFVPHVRTMNAACEIAYQILTTKLSSGVGKKPKDPVTGGVYILERDALAIEGSVNTALANPLKNQVAGFQFTLLRTDDLSANSGATLNGKLQIVALAYIKAFKVLASFAKSISVTV